MIYWSCSEFPEWSDDSFHLELEGSLGPRETREFRRLKVPKRRAEWLAARIAVKKLVQSCSQDTAQHDLRLIETIKDPSGVPHVEIDGKRHEGYISLSHSQGRVFCACALPENRLGVDIEHIEVRPPEFVTDYFTHSEMLTLLSVEDALQPLLATLIWSAKEALLKGISLGLNLDTRSVEILNLVASIPAAHEWVSLEFRSTVRETSSLHLFWRREDDFVLTVCASTASPDRFVRLEPSP